MNQRLPASILLLVFMMMQMPFSAFAQSFRTVDSVLDPQTYGLGGEYREFSPLRTEKTVTFVKRSGEFVTVGALADVFTHDENGALVPIDESGRIIESGIVFDRLAQDASVVFSRVHPSYTFSKGGHSFTLTYRGDAVATLESPNTVSYRLARNVVLRFTVHGSSVTKSIFVTGPVDPADLRFSVTQDTDLTQRLIQDEIILSDESGIDVFRSDAPNLQDTEGRILDHLISFRPLGDGMYEYLYDPEGLPETYVIDPNTRFKDPRSVSGGWTNSSNIIGSDDVYATRTLASNLLAASLVPLFAFFIPDPDATISGMTVQVERKTDAVSPENVKDNSLTLTIDGNISDNRAAPLDWSTSDVTKEYGGPSDLWGLTGLTPAKMKAVTATFTAFCNSVNCC